MGISKTSDHIQIKIKMPNPSEEPPASSKAPNQDLKDMDVLCTFKIKIESQNFEHGCIKDQRPYANQDANAKPQSEMSSVLQSNLASIQFVDTTAEEERRYSAPPERSADVSFETNPV